MRNRPILVIDDDPQCCELVTALLAAADFEVIAATDGPQGIELAREARPAVIILDLLLPGMDGLSTLAALKRDPVLKDIPAVAVTASPDLTHSNKAFRAGALFFLPKPFSGPSLLRAVELAVEAAQPAAMQRRRRHPRLPVTVPVQCSVLGERRDTRGLAGHTENVSLGGVLLLLPEAVTPGSTVRLRLALPGGPVTATGAVRWKGAPVTQDGAFRHGVQLTRFEGAAAQYRRYVSGLVARSDGSRSTKES